MSDQPDELKVTISEQDLADLETPDADVDPQAADDIEIDVAPGEPVDEDAVEAEDDSGVTETNYQQFLPNYDAEDSNVYINQILEGAAEVGDNEYRLRDDAQNDFEQDPPEAQEDWVDGEEV